MKGTSSVKSSLLWLWGKVLKWTDTFWSVVQSCGIRSSSSDFKPYARGHSPSHFSRIWTVSPISNDRPNGMVPRKLAMTVRNDIETKAIMLIRGSYTATIKHYCIGKWMWACCHFPFIYLKRKSLSSYILPTSWSNKHHEYTWKLCGILHR